MASLSLIISTNILTRREYRLGHIKVATFFCQYEAPLAAKSGFSPSQHSHSPPITLSLPPLPHSSSYSSSNTFAQLLNNNLHKNYHKESCAMPKKYLSEIELKMQLQVLGV